jgi:glycosyltransferase involved in cell wall biosynthesis
MPDLAMFFIGKNKKCISLVILVCIPALNEERIIGDLVRKTLCYTDQVVVCDDGSTDNTASESKSAGENVIRHEKNKGKGAAIKSLFKYAIESNADIVVTIDGDGQFLPEEITKLVKPVIEKKSDIVIGYRFDDKTEMPSYRKAGNKILDKITNLASNLPFRDTQSGFRAYSKKAIELIKFTNDGFGADSEILVDASKKGLKISEEKVTVIYNTGTKTSTKNPVLHISEVIASLIEIIAIGHPLKYLGIPGLILLIVGIVYSVVVLSIFNETRYFSIPSTFLALSSLIMGLMLLLMSVVLFSIGRAIKKIH